MTIHRIVTAAVVTSLLVVPAAAEQPERTPAGRTSVQELVLVDGSRFYGATESVTEAETVFRTLGGVVVRVPSGRIVSIRPVVGRVVDEEFRREDPNNTRLLFGPTGEALPRGSAYFGVYELMLPFVQIGVTDRLSIGGGTPLVVDFAESSRPFWITPKLQLLSRGGTHAAAGLFHGTNPAGDGFGIAYGVVTRRTGGGAVTVGGGIGYTSNGHRGPVVMVGGHAPMRRTTKFVTENYVWSSGGIAAAGFRFFGEKMSADVGLALFFEHGSGFVLGLPVVNFMYRF